MTSPFLRNYALLCIKSSHLRNIAALGGMAAQIPIKNNAFAKEQALKVIRQDKEREANDGKFLFYFPFILNFPVRIHFFPLRAPTTALSLIALAQECDASKALNSLSETIPSSTYR